MASNVTLCPLPMKATSNGAFQNESPLDYALPLAILQICIVLVLTRTLAFLLRSLRQPRVIAEIVGGILLGPSAFGKSKAFLHAVFPPRSLTVMDTLANLGLLFFLFLVGLEMDLKSLKKTGKKTLCIAIAGISIPFILGIGTSVVLRSTISKGVPSAPFLVFMGVALSITAFPVLARILAELKLLTTDLGRIAMSAAAVNDVAAWILLALAISLSGSETSPLTSLWVLLCGIGFVTLCVFLVTPIFKWICQRCPDGEPVKEIYICGTLGLVLAASFITDTIGIHALFGAFVLGVLVPNEGPLASALVEKLEDLVSGLLLPLYFASSGLKTDLFTIQGARSWALLLLVIVTACAGKILGTVGVALSFKMPFQESLALGFLMNSKGLVELIVLNIGKDRKVLNDQTFAILVLMALFTTFITTPLVMAVYKPAKRVLHSYKHRTVQRKDLSSELRILACFNSSRNIPTMINLIEASRGTEKKHGLSVYAMHLMELSERSSAIRMVQKARKNGLPFWNKGTRADSNQVEVAFESYERLSRVYVKPMTAISHMSDIHTDVCSSAEDKRAALIVLPFHKHQMLDGSLETTCREYRAVNWRVLESAPCSVAILVDRGLGGPAHVAASNVDSVITVLFFGGPDDREALALARRMAEHPGITIDVVHLKGREKAEDEHGMEAIGEVREDGSVRYVERAVGSRAEVVEAVKEFGKSNMFVVGRSPLGQVAELIKVKSECPELGPVAGLLISPELPTAASVLVVQQYRGVVRQGGDAVVDEEGGSGNESE